MTTIPVVVKHSGQKYNVDIDTTKTGLDLKLELQKLTNVVPERQKVLVKGGQLKDDVRLSALGFKPNQTLMMLGSAGDLPTAPANVAQEASSADADSAKVDPVPAGLVNIGNTCYANATLQALRKAPELVEAVQKYQGQNSLTTALGRVYTNLNSGEEHTPFGFMERLRSTFPQFAEMGQMGPKQQDAEEMWTNLMYSLKEAGVAPAERYFDGQMAVKMSSAETDEPPAESYDTFAKLNCHISASTNFLKDGLMAGLKETLEKHNEALGRNAEYTVTKRISRLPKYLTIQFVRFFWRRDTSKKSKILRKVTFPLQLDVSDLCTDDLRAKLVPAREEFRKAEDAVEEARRAARRAKFQSMETRKEAINDSLSEERRKELHDNIVAKIDPTLADDEGSNPLGIYELVAIVTHQGMSADSGHYQCFAKHDKEPGQWWRFNDNKVTLVDDAKIEQLSGGGESDSALILLYRTAEY
ncbi:Ubiquitin carboxyl-terminal hydrolase 6 [Wickerhamiella sorbophila]|uniref:Ubiquitin carboxyl-terminal hydrolase n=1 Tax=Wickerhamiella sorbophila TaxID=45607 RepID=A0A2T0FEH9_9ASCO|nr:Ubiquitin carboxyl-terminal hydrolase 6 [Wickerhamiella sorbophila]PRT53406.1 Ubiquitin carboxyl-terminal hydrolase 6 [Wickerhamiella sorbophila]